MWADLPSRCFCYETLRPSSCIFKPIYRALPRAGCPHVWPQRPLQEAGAVCSSCVFHGRSRPACSPKAWRQRNCHRWVSPQRQRTENMCRHGSRRNRVGQASQEPLRGRTTGRHLAEPSVTRITCQAQEKQSWGIFSTSRRLHPGAELAHTAGRTLLLRL